MITDQLRLSENYNSRKSYNRNYFLNCESAFRNLLILLSKEGLKIDQIKDLNKGRYKIVKSRDGNNLLLVFKRRPFFEYGSKFINNKSREAGDTINEDALKIAKSYGVTNIYSVFSSGDVYKIGLKEYMDKSNKWINSENKEVRSISLNDYKKVMEMVS